MEYRVPVTYKVFGHVFVEAKDKKDLIKKLKDARFVENMPLATDDIYILKIPMRLTLRVNFQTRTSVFI